MLIHEAIKIAGPGGKIRMKLWHECVPSFIIPTHSNGNMEQEFEYGAAQVNSPDMLTATDWEVIPEERIELGDTVMSNYCKSEHCFVIGGEGTRYALTWAEGHTPKPNCICIAPTSDLTLIHKGPKVERSIKFKFMHSPGPDVYHFGNGFRLEPGYRPVEGQEIEIAIEREPDVS